MNLDDALITFFSESRSLLEDMESALLRLEGQPDDAEAVNAVFRAAHTIKGSAGLFGLDAIVAFTHTAESVLDRARNRELAFDGDLVGLFLECRDHIETLLARVADKGEADAAELAREAALLVRLSAYLATEEKAAASNLPAEAEAQVHSSGGGTVADCWHISLRPSADALRNGMDPLSIVRYLETFGEIVYLSTLADALPAAAEMDPESCYLGFEIGFRSDADKARIEAAFEFIREDSLVRILPPGSRIDDFIALIEELPEDKTRLGELLVAAGALTEAELARVLERQAQDAGTQPPLGNLLVAERLVQPEIVDAALAKQKEARGRSSQEAKMIRVHADKLDSLINLVGELVIAGSGVGLLARSHRDAGLTKAVLGLSRLVEEIRDNAMHLRMVEIGECFNRFRRVVRDVAKELGKDIELAIAGADTELDKTVVEKITDPLTHLVRNAMDHGIEPADTRIAQGKPAAGRIALNAYHESGGIVIEVSDDGGGLNRQRILAKARQNGLVAEGAEPADQDVWALIFEPGFSTAEQVSNLSGRGVGMDVVRRNIAALRGSIEIDSREGLGTTFRIRLPLTLAIIDGFLMQVGDGHFVVPLDLVLECVEIRAGQELAQRDVLNLRGEALPLLRLREHFAVDGRNSRRQNIVVVQCGGRKAGLVVDELKGEFQAVLKPLGRLFESLPGIAGSTILGSGEVALMLDVPTLLAEAARAETRALAASV